MPSEQKGWVYKDPLGVSVVLFEKTWSDHIIAVHPGMGSNFVAIIKTITDPDIIFHNLPDPTRIAKLKYCKNIYLGSSIGFKHLTIPVADLSMEYYIPGYGTVGPGYRVVKTAYPASKLSCEPMFWRKT